MDPANGQRLVVYEQPFGSARVLPARLLGCSSSARVSSAVQNIFLMAAMENFECLQSQGTRIAPKKLTPACTPSYGTLYNSGIQSMSAAHVPCLAVVISDSQTEAVVAELRLHILRAAKATAMAELEAVTSSNCHPAIRRLDRYLCYPS